MNRARRALLAGLLCLSAGTGAAQAGETPLPFAQDLPRFAAASVQQGLPMILLVSLTDCTYCEKIRRQHLLPLSQAGVPVWQIHLDTDGQMINFAGQPTTERQFAKVLKVRVAPSLYFFDAQGRQLAEPLIGTMLDDFYGAYLDNAIALSRQQLQGRRTK